MRTESGTVRSDLTTSFGASTTRAEGIPLEIAMTIQDFAQVKAAMVGPAVYLWHCDRAGQYSLYSPAVTGENYLRGVQETSDQGTVTFTSILPACYGGRWPHIHFEVYPSLAKATNSVNKVATSQMAIPESAVSTAYATVGYEQSVTTLERVTMADDKRVQRRLRPADPRGHRRPDHGLRPDLHLRGLTGPMRWWPHSGWPCERGSGLSGR